MQKWTVFPAGAHLVTLIFCWIRVAISLVCTCIVDHCFSRCPLSRVRGVRVKQNLHQWRRTVYQSGAHQFTIVSCGVWVTRSLLFCAVLCRSLFVMLSPFFFWRFLVSIYGCWLPPLTSSLHFSSSQRELYVSKGRFHCKMFSSYSQSPILTIAMNTPVHSYIPPFLCPTDLFVVCRLYFAMNTSHMMWIHGMQ